MKLVRGDELRLKHNQTVDGSEWSVIGSVIKIPDSEFFRKISIVVFFKG